jgi:hypothetical protein
MSSPRVNTLVKRSFKEALERGRKDPVLFAWDFLGLDLYAQQQAFVREFTRPGIKEGVLSAGNRWGKGEVAAVLELWHAFYQHRNEEFAETATGRLRAYTAINVSVSLAQAEIVFNKAAGYAQNSKRFEPFVDRVINSPFPTMRLKPIPGLSDKGAEFWARSTAYNAKFLLGQNFQYLNFDEAALEPNLETILNDVIRMRLADSGGTMTFTSQPRGKNAFYQVFMRGQPGAVNDPRIYSQFGCSFDNPWIDHDHIRRSMEFMTPGQIAENIYGQFSDEQQFFPADRVMACYKDQNYTLPVPPFMDVLWRSAGGETRGHYAEAKGQPVYVMGVDVARMHDQTAVAVLRVDEHPYRLVSFELFGRMDWRLIKEKIAATHKRYRAWGMIDVTGAGQPVHESLISPDEPYQCDLEGYNFAGSSGNKLTLLVQLQTAIQNRELVFPYHRELVDQLLHYQLEDKKLATDAVFGLALAVKAANDWAERQRFQPVHAPDLPIATRYRDRQTGLWLFSNPDEDDDEGLPHYWRHLV